MAIDQDMQARIEEKLRNTPLVAPTNQSSEFPYGEPATFRKTSTPFTIEASSVTPAQSSDIVVKN